MAAALAGCKEHEPPKAPPPAPPASQEKASVPLSPEKQARYRKMKAEFDAEMAKIPPDQRAREEAFAARVKAADEAELVRPAPPGFKPEPFRRKVRLKLIPKKTVLKPGEVLWYRVELQNLGREAISFNPSGRSFWKAGNAEFDKWRFLITPPGGKEVDALIQYYLQDGVGPGARGRMNAAQREDHAFRMLRLNSLNVAVMPGETLVTKAWRLLSYTELNDQSYRDITPAPVEGDFRELALEEFRFKAPGVYRVKVVFLDPPLYTERHFKEAAKSGSEGEATIRYYNRSNSRRLGTVESNTVRIEVKP